MKFTTKLHDRKYAMIGMMIGREIPPPYVKPLGNSSKYMSISPNHHSSTKKVKLSCAVKQKNL